MANKRSLPPETVSKRRKLQSAELAPPPEMHIFQRSPSPESGLANWSRGIRGLFSNLDGVDQNDEVVNSATPKPSNVILTASDANSTLDSQIPRLPEDVGLLTSIASTKRFRGGLVDDKSYEVSADKFRAAELLTFKHACSTLL
jgi:hypothetical protein